MSLLQVKALPLAAAWLALGPWGYLPEVCGGGVTGAGRDLSFGVFVQDVLVGYFPCFMHDGTLGWVDGTSTIPLFQHAGEVEANDVGMAMRDQVSRILHMGEAREAKLCTSGMLPLYLFQDFAVVDNERMYGFLDLSLTTAAMRATLRKSYRSLVNYANDRVVRRIVTSVDEVQADLWGFLAESPGHSQATSAMVMQRMNLGESALISYRYEGHIAGVVEISRWRKFRASGDVLYMTGAYRHDLAVSSHYCLFDAALLAKELGFERLYLLDASRTYRAPGDANQRKLAAIDFFKRGFCSDLFLHNYITISLA